MNVEFGIWSEGIRNRLAQLVVLSVMLASARLLLACGGDSEGGGANDCASLGKYKFSLACDAQLGGIHQCTEYYGSFPAGYPERTTDQSVCTAMSGTVLPGKCSAEDSVGSCRITSTVGAYGEVAVVYGYASATLTAASYQSACDGIYAPSGQTSGEVAGGAGSESCGSTSTTGATAAGGGFSFSVETDLNGEPLECTNYFGAQKFVMTSELSTGDANTHPCPNNGKVISVCDIHKTGPLGNRQTLIYYGTVETGSQPTETMSSCSAQGGTYSTSYSVP